MCYAAWGPDADRHDKSLLHMTLEGSCFGTDSLPMIFAGDLGFSNGESTSCEMAFESRHLCLVGWRLIA
jgi:hypothetical protein